MRLLRHRRGNPDPEYVEAYPTAPPLDSTLLPLFCPLEHSDPISPSPRAFKYQEADPSITMQVLEAVAPGGARAFIAKELFGRLGITNFAWENDVSGLPKAAAGCGLRSRDMLKWGLLILAHGKWQGEQLIPASFVQRATSPITLGYGTSYYGYFWWVDDFQVGGRTYHSIEGRGAGGQFIFMFPELELIAVVTAHTKGMGNMLGTLPNRIVPAFVRRQLLFPLNDN